MKKSISALLALGLFAGTASAQLVIQGKIDQAVGKPVGTANRQVMDTAGSRLAFRGSEDLGGGWSAIFALEHRFMPDTGGQASTSTFWEGFSLVGLRSPTLGMVTVGRQYTSGFLNVQNSVDPFEGETVAALRGIFMGASYGTADAPGDSPNSWAGAPTGIGAAKGRVANSVKYMKAFLPVVFSADIAEVPAGGVKRPYSVAVSYNGKATWLGAAFENASGAHDQVFNLGVRQTFGAVAVSGGLTDGRINTASNNKLRAYLLGLNVTVGAGQIKAGYATSKVAGIVRNARTGLGYHHSLSKRTKLYADIAHEGKGSTRERQGYDLGIQHHF